MFVDTPGIHRPLHRLNVRMVDAAVETLREVDVVALVFDASSKPGRGDEFVLDLLTDVTRAGRARAEQDRSRVRRPALLPLIEQVGAVARLRRDRAGSAATGDGVDRLERVLLEQLPEGDPIYPDDYLTDQPERALAAEIVREKVLQHTRDELPFSTAVRSTSSTSRSANGCCASTARSASSSESQKPIVIGRGGEMIKRIGTEARQDLERFFETKVFLDLRVKVNPDWRNNERTLDELGVPNGPQASTSANPHRGISGTFPPLN